MDCSKIILLHVVIFTNVIYASHICGLCPAGFYYKGCNNSSPLCESCPKDSFKPGLNAVANCNICTKCVGRNNIVVHKCNSTHDTVCRCRNGYFFDERIALCSRCSKCVGKNNIVVRRCDGTQNTVCRCKDGYYFDTGVLYCARCSRCRRGQGVSRNCTSKANTQCDKCVKGFTFSSLRSKTDSCQACKICAQNEEIEKDCTRKKDTNCKIIPENKVKEFKLKNKSKWLVSFENRPPTKVPKITIATTSSTEALDTTKADEGPTSSVVGAKKRTSESVNGTLTTLELSLAIAGAVLVLVVLVTVCAVLRYRARTTTANTNTTTTIVKKAPLSYPHHHHAKPREEINRLSRTPLMTGSTELLRDANFSIIEELSSCLNPKGRWKSLAARLGFTSKCIENFDIEPTHATERMLSEWGHQKNTTVHKLYEVLVGMKFNHEADVVNKYLNIS